MAEFVYALCLLTSCVCAGLLLRSYARSRATLLLWTSLCFIGLAINNVLLLVDLVVVPQTDLRVLRDGTGLGALIILAFGLIWERA